jgi:Uma2 family endonuclease
MEDVKYDISILNEPDSSYGYEYTYADYLKFEFEEMVELIKGKIFRMSPAPRSKHQIINGNLFGPLWTFLKNKKCQVFIAPFDVILPIANKKREKATTVVQPDICVICDPELVEEAGCFGVPDWIIEILSPHNSKKDLNDKYKVYEEAGVKEYWIVMPEERIVEVFYLENEQYKRLTSYVSSDTISSLTLPEFSIDLNEVFPN